MPRRVRVRRRKMPRRVRGAHAAKKVESVFPGDMCVAKNTSRRASVSFARPPQGHSGPPRKPLWFAWGEEFSGEAPPVAEEANRKKGSGAIGKPQRLANRKAAT